MAASLKELLSKAKSKSMYFGFGKGKDKKSHTLILNPSKAVNESEVKKENKAAQSVCVGKTEPKEGAISLIVTGGSPGASMDQWLAEACKAAGIPAPKFEIVTKSDVNADEQQVEQPPLKEGGEDQLNSKTDKQATQESPQQDNADLDAEDDGEDIKSVILKAIKRTPEKPLYFQLVMKGKKGKINIARRLPTKGKLTELVKEVGGGKPYRGLCYGGDGGELVLECFKKLPKKIDVMKMLRKEVRKAINVILTLGANELADDEEQADGGDPAKLLFLARWVNIKPDCVEALKMQPPLANAPQIKTLASAVMGLAKNGDHAAANKALDQLEELLIQALADEEDLEQLDPIENELDETQEGEIPNSPTPPETSKVEQVNPLEESWNQKKREVETLIEEALSKDKSLAELCAKVTAQGQKLVNAKSFKDAIKLYTALEAKLRKTAGIEVGFVDLQKCRLAWDNARKQVQSELQNLEKIIVDKFKAHNSDDNNEVKYDITEVAANTKNLYTILDKLDNRLIDKLDEALNAEPDDRKVLQQDAKQIIVEYQEFVKTDSLMVGIDDNPFLKGSIRKDVERVLSSLESML